MDDKTLKLIEIMTPEQRLNLTRAASDQLMMLGQEFRASRNRLSEIAGFVTSDISEFTSMIEKIDHASRKTATVQSQLSGGRYLLN